MCLILTFVTGLFPSPFSVINGIDRQIAITAEPARSQDQQPEEFTGDLQIQESGEAKTGQEDEAVLVPEDMPETVAPQQTKSNIQIIGELFRGLESQYVKKSDQVEHQYNGVIGFFVNNINSSDSIVYGIINGINQIVFRDAIGSGIVIFLGVVLTVLIWIFFQNLVLLGGYRFFLENHRYYSTDLKRVLFTWRVKHIGNQALVMLLKTVYQVLWSLTIVGAFVKPYSYLMVPYIMAENPAADRKKVFLLSRKMMKGNKWRAFVTELSFLPLMIANLFTLGLVNIFYLNPYYTATFAELYFVLRKKAL